jgi:hypothetical protein
MRYPAKETAVKHERIVRTRIVREASACSANGYNLGEFLTDDPKEITVYNDNVNTGPTGRRKRRSVI